MELKEIKEKLREMAPAFAQRIAPVYNFLKWEWSPEGSVPHIPKAKEIEETLHSLIEGLSEEYFGHGTGGLEVYYEPPDKETGGGGEYGMLFKIEEIEGYDDSV